ncbi:MAG: hypothetical protein ABJG88_11025 [Litorimonas sp.]
MFQKVQLWPLVIFGLMASGCSAPKPEGVGASYICEDIGNPEQGLLIRTILRLNKSEEASNYNLGGIRRKAYELYQADITYYTLQRNLNNPDTFTSTRTFEYEKVDFEYDRKELIIKIPEDDGMPTCEIRFDKDGKVGEHICEFDKNGAGHRAETFKVKCKAQIEKVRIYKADEL